MRAVDVAAEMGETAGGGSERAPRRAVVVRVVDVRPEPVRWLWPGRIPLGKLTLIAGDPGVGKSCVTLDLAARVSSGTPWPDAPDEPNEAGGVVLLSAEDDAGDTIRPRLDAAGADVRRIALLQAVRVASDDARETATAFCLTADLDALEEAIGTVGGCRLVVVDPVSAYLGGTDSHVNADVRAALAPLAGLAARLGVAVVAVTHLRKGEGPAMYRAMGSLAFAAAARAYWGVAKDRDDATGRRRLLLPVKNNVAPDTGGLAYALDPAPNGTAVVAWEPEPVNVTADDALAFDDRQRDGGAVEEAVAWLRDRLANGPVPARVVKEGARADGIAPRTLDRAKATLGVKPRRTDFSGGCWVWGLPRRAPSEPKSANILSLALFDGVGALREAVHDGSLGGSNDESAET